MLFDYDEQCSKPRPSDPPALEVDIATQELPG